jgi:hypothetical protein
MLRARKIKEHIIEHAVLGLASSVKSFGATGDGSTDDTAAIQAAIDAADGKTVLIPNGTYVVENLTPPASGNLVLVGTPSPEGALPKLVALNSNSSNGILLTNHSGDLDVKIQGLAFDDFSIAIFCGSAFSDTLNVDVRDCKITNCQRGIFINNDCRKAYIYNNRITDMYSATDISVAIGLGVLVGAANAETGKFFIEGNYIKNVRSDHTAASVETHAIWCEGYYARAIDNYIENVGAPHATTGNGGEAIYVIAAFSKILHNTIIDGCYNGQGAIVLKGDRGTTGSEGHSTEVAFNTLEEKTSGRMNAGIYNACENSIHIHHNIIDGCGFGGYYNGSHDGSGNSGILSDSGASWPVDALIGLTVYNITDDSEGTITDNTATTVTATLAGGTDNDWDASDEYVICGYDSVAAQAECVALHIDAIDAGARNIRVEHNQLYNSRCARNVYWRAPGSGHSFSHNYIHVKGNPIPQITLCKAVEFNLTNAIDGFKVVGNEVDFPATVTTNANLVQGIVWVAGAYTHTGIKWLYNQVTLDDQTKDNGGGAITSLCYSFADNASQVLQNCQVCFNVASGSHDTDWNASPSTGTHVNSIEAYNSWNNAGAGAWIVETF